MRPTLVRPSSLPRGLTKGAHHEGGVKELSYLGVILPDSNYLTMTIYSRRGIGTASAPSTQISHHNRKRPNARRIARRRRVPVELRAPLRQHGAPRLSRRLLRPA